MLSRLHKLSAIICLRMRINYESFVELGEQDYKP